MMGMIMVEGSLRRLQLSWVELSEKMEGSQPHEVSIRPSGGASFSSSCHVPCKRIKTDS